MFFFYFGRFSKQMCQITFSTLGLKVEDSEIEHIIEETTKVKKFKPPFKYQISSI